MNYSQPEIEVEEEEDAWSSWLWICNRWKR
jgi:hypothetical protein